MSDTLFLPLPSLRLSDDDIPPATATLCRWHPQPRPRPPKPRSFSTPARGPRHARQPNHRPRYPFNPAAPSESGQVAQNLALNPHRPTLPPAHTPRGFLLRGFSDACLHAGPRAVTAGIRKPLTNFPVPGVRAGRSGIGATWSSLCRHRPARDGARRNPSPQKWHTRFCC